MYLVNLYDCKILLVDDNRELLAMTEDILKRNGYDLVVTAESCREAEKKFEEERPHLVILDIMLPDGDGFTLFRTLREHSQAPILFLSARDEDNDRLFGLGLGADDYITKPFLPQELALRVSAVLKRSYFSPQGMEPEEALTLGRRKISLRNAVVEWEGQSVSLTAKELLLLQKLSRNRGNIVTFDALCRAAWNDDYYGYENVLMVHIRHLREKIEEDPSHPEYLLTARGLGYRLAAERKDGR
ncbi:MAG: response regulator transcription factor [Muribaculaceae bacterium]|nr:response regulator transcription factor [Muribaculaceae bacterium]